MSISAASELIRQLGLELGLDDLDFSDLSIGLVVDLARVVAEYLPAAESFLIYGRVAEGIETQDGDLMRRINDFSHASVMQGAGALTIDQTKGEIVYSLRLDIEGLTAEILAKRISQVASFVTAYGAFLSGPSMMKRPASYDPAAIRV